MMVLAICGASGVGKTTLIEALIGELKRAGQRVSVVKHAHKGFEIDHPGKDSFRHRAAGAFEVVVASAQRLAKVREFEAPVELGVHQLLAELSACDWALVEGFRNADLLKLEVWRESLGERPAYPDDPFVVAVATDDPARLPTPTSLPVFQMTDIATLASHLLRTAQRHEYRPQNHA
jgi:molybdopterin-guanine dinucleotide biosynthesis protein B